MTISYGDVIRMRRKELHMSIEALADEACVSTPMVRRAENGGNCMIDNILSIMSALGLKMDFVEIEK